MPATPIWDRFIFRQRLDSCCTSLPQSINAKEDTMQESRLFRTPMLARLMVLVCGITLGSAALAGTSPQVSIKTSEGEIVLELDQEKAPKTVANFLQYVKSGHYKGTIFHRVIDGFMIQGGGMTAKMVEKRTGAAVRNESDNGLTNSPYTVAMARTAAPHSATAQFFINVADNAMLNYPGRDGFGYAVFGKVVSGQEVVDKIKGVLVDDVNGHQNVPVIPIVIQSATVLK
jgi:peptidyl-prolyl cis-trans isomerase A (cyclophilin A)/peptidyl-prolyl cis-trans isomerase B (cyclophilin B)